MPRNPNKIDYSRGFPDGFEAFEELKDTRKDGHTKHHFGEILFMAFTIDPLAHNVIAKLDLEEIALGLFRAVFDGKEETLVHSGDAGQHIGITLITLAGALVNYADFSWIGDHPVTQRS